MAEGLAHTMTYGDGSGNTTTHYYAGTVAKPKKRKKPLNDYSKMDKSKVQRKASAVTTAAASRG